MDWRIKRGIGFTVRIGRPEAIDLFRKWVSDAAPLRVHFSFSLFALSFLGRIKEVSDARLCFLSDDTTSELELPLPGNLEFGYGDDRRFAGEGLAGVTLFFPVEVGTEPDTISFFEVADVR
jgi:hypothetical protein